MVMQRVESSNVEEIGYDEENQIMNVRYKNNSLYCYKGVPQNEYDALLYAPSVGKYLHSNIKGVYPYERIE